MSGVEKTVLTHANCGCYQCREQSVAINNKLLHAIDEALCELGRVVDPLDLHACHVTIARAYEILSKAKQ